MTSVLSPRRSRWPTVLRASFARDEPEAGPDPQTEPPPLGWLVLGAGGAAATALATWVLVAGACVIAWLATEPGTLAGALAVGTRLWLLAHGGGAELGGLRLTLVPWAVTGLVALLVGRFAVLAGRQAVAGPDRARGPARVTATVTAVALTAYLVPLLAVALTWAGPGSAARAAAVTSLVVGLAAALGAARGSGWQPTRSWPAWARPLPGAVAAAQLVLLAAGGLTLLASLVVHRERVLALHASLDPGLVGGAVLVGAQLALLPNAVVWAASYALGAGFTLGGGTVVAPAAAEVGLLPALPLLGALPTPAAGGSGALAWLAVGGLAGVVAAWFVVRARPSARLDETAVVGGLAAVAAAVVFTGLAWASGGDLGVGRLAGAGPRLLPLLVVGATTMGLAGTTCGLVLGGLRWYRARRPGRAEPR